MFAHDVNLILQRDLARLKEELSLYKYPADMWKTAPGTANSAGNLALHLAGNLRHFIGNVLGNSGYVRNRDAEFSAKDLPLHEVNRILDDCSVEVALALSTADAAVLEADFPKEINGITYSGYYVLLHLLAHFNYHLGQVNYHRRMITASNSNSL